MSEYNQVKTAVKIARRRMLDHMEAILRNTQYWDIVRTSILRAFGNNGLEGTVDVIFEKDKESDL